MAALLDVPRASWSRLAQQLFASLPSTRILHIGADDPALLEELIARGLDAHGHVLGGRTPMATQSPTPVTSVTACRFHHGPLGSLDAAAGGSLDRRFSTVVWSARLDGGVDLDLGRLAELVADVVRITDRHLLVCLGTATPAGQTLAWGVRRDIERLFLARGCRKHPARFLFGPFQESLPSGSFDLFVFERLADARRAPLAKNPPRDILIDARATADDRAADYAFAAQLIERQDVVIDIGCGAGDGTAILHDSSSAARIIGIADHRPLLDYAHDTYGASRARMTFVETLAHGVADCSADLVVALDYTPPATALDRLLAQAVRVLLPGGRLVIDGRRHVHGSVSAFAARIEPTLRIERVLGHVGDARDHDDRPHRWLVPFASAAEADAHDTDHCLIVALKDPITHQQPRPTAIAHPRAQDPALDLESAIAGYENPWLPYGLVIGTRTTSRELLIEFARRTLDRAAPRSADRGAALCVLAYRLLERDASVLADRESLEAALTEFIAVTPASPIELRWCISNAYVLGRLHLQSGRHDLAEHAFARCANLDGLPYRALIATKTVEAAFWSGWLAHRRHDLALARLRWEQGIDTARRALADGWSSCLAARDIPIPYGLREAGIILAAADRCYQALEWSRLDDDRIRELARLAFPS